MRRIDWSAYGFIAPFMLLYAAFLLGPLVMAFAMSLYRGGLLFGLEYCGGCNYAEVWRNPLFAQALHNTGLYTLLVVPMVTVLSLCVALLIYRLPEGLQTFIKAALMMPLLSSAVASAIIWNALLSPAADGPLNWLIGLMGIAPQNWLGHPHWVVPSIAVFEIWRGYGFYVLVFLAGLMAIPRDVYEAAYVDGAGGFKAFLYITLPLLRPTVLLVTVLAVIFNFQLFDAVLMLTSGGPANRSMSVVYYLYRSVFAFDNLGHAATMSVLLFLIVMALTLVQLRIGRERE